MKSTELEHGGYMICTTATACTANQFAERRVEIDLQLE